jgi:hypothetical protein
MGCHHKTGTQLLDAFVRETARRFLEPIAFGTSYARKIPLSHVLREMGESYLSYVNICFEHQIDVPAESIRFLHFVRHPIRWIRSAFLYHKMGGPLEGIPWLRWRIFRLDGSSLSYHELLNCVDWKIGSIIEAIRSYPEIAGSARAADTSSDLRHRLQVSLEQFQLNFDHTARSIYEFLKLPPGEMEATLNAFAKMDISRMRSEELPSNITRSSISCEPVEVYLSQHSGIFKLYSDLAVPMGFVLDRPTAPSTSLLDEEILGMILKNKPFLLTHSQSMEAKAFLPSDKSQNEWRAVDRQQFGGGHLMMCEFIQAFLDKQ